jgi:uncharacterized paraquat-inducible protein A
MKKVITIVLFIALIALSQELAAQCPMCKTSLEEARKSGSQVGSTLNNGILYLLALPYTIAVVFGFLWWRNSKLKKQQANNAL